MPPSPQLSDYCNTEKSTGAQGSWLSKKRRRGFGTGYRVGLRVSSENLLNNKFSGIWPDSGSGVVKDKTGEKVCLN